MGYGLEIRKAMVRFTAGTRGFFLFKSVLNDFGRLYPQEILLVLMSVTGCVDPMATVRPEGLSQRKIPVAPSGIKSATSRHVAHCFNQLRHGMPPPLPPTKKKKEYKE